MAIPTPQSDEPAQIDKFRDLARELECDEDEAAFDERLKQIVPTPKTDKPKS